MSKDEALGQRAGKPEPAQPAACPYARNAGPRSASKIGPAQLDRLAIVYIRQSSPQQVLDHRESRARQYALAGYAQDLGWRQQCRGAERLPTPADGGDAAARGSDPGPGAEPAVPLQPRLGLPLGCLQCLRYLARRPGRYL